MTDTDVIRHETLADLVTARPAAARLFERHALDYCCGGGRPLDEACADAGIDPEVVMGELARLEAEPQPVSAWASMGPAELVDHLEATHHAYLHAELPRLSALAAKVVGVHGARHPELELVLATYERLRADLDPHLLKEERILFPLIRRLAGREADPAAPVPCGGSVRGPVSVMMAEHDQAGALLERLRMLTEGYTLPADACGSYQALYAGLAELEADTHLHVHKENNVLFPAVVALEGA